MLHDQNISEIFKFQEYFEKMYSCSVALIRIFIIKIFLMAGKQKDIFLKYHWNLNISEILQVKNIQELLSKYHFHRFMTSIEI